jgi:hypothetical protein
MNGIWNAIFIISLLLMMMAFTWLYSISDVILTNLYTTVDGIEPNDMTDNGLDLYEKLRDFTYNGLNNVLLPFLLFLSLASSFINKNASMASYLIQAMGVVLITPIMVYVFADVLTAMTSVSIINTSYMFSNYLGNLLYIMVANMLLALASFVFIQKSVQYA